MKKPDKLVGLPRLIKAFEYSCDGLKATYESEQAFRQDVLLVAVLFPFSFFVAETLMQWLLLIFTLVFLLIAELLNTAIEATIERISPDWHPLSKKAKDIGSAVVLLALGFLGVTWTTLLLT